MSEQIPSIGRIVHFHEKNAHGVMVTRPAIIVHVWDTDPDNSCVQLQVFNDGDGSNCNDGLPNVTWKTSVQKNQEEEPSNYRWDWPPRA